MLSVGINTAPLAAARTGVGRYITGLLGGLSALGLPGPGLSAPGLSAPGLSAPGAEAVEIRPLFRPGAPAKGLRSLVKRLPFAYPLAEAARAVALRRERPTVYHETNHAAPAFAGPVVLTVHDLSTVLHAATQEPRRARHFARALLGRARDAALVVTPTEAIAREVHAHLHVPRERIRAIHHGVDARFVPGGERRKQVLFVGAQGPRKGVETLRAAMPAGFELVLAGPPRFVPEDELLALYQAAAVLVLPSLYEGFGFPLVEAFSCGTPAIASDDPALLEVSQGAALHFPRGDVEALRALLVRVTTDPGLQRELSERGLARARAFSWSACAAAHVDVYREAARGAAGSGTHSRSPSRGGLE